MLSYILVLNEDDVLWEVYTVLFLFIFANQTHFGLDFTLWENPISRRD